MTTREEAIAYFKRHLDLYCVDGISREAEEMAIKALEQEPCEDAISREDLIQKFYDDVFIRDKTDSKEDYQQVFASTVLAVIKSLPPVTPKGVTITDFANKCRECGREKVLDKIMEEIEQVKSIMNEEIINNNRKDLINFVNGLNQSLVIVERYKAESEG